MEKKQNRRGPHGMFFEAANAASWWATFLCFFNQHAHSIKGRVFNFHCNEPLTVSTADLSQKTYETSAKVLIK